MPLLVVQILVLIYLILLLLPPPPFLLLSHRPSPPGSHPSCGVSIFSLPIQCTCISDSVTVYFPTISITNIGLQSTA